MKTPNKRFLASLLLYGVCACAFGKPLQITIEGLDSDLKTNVESSLSLIEQSQDAQLSQSEIESLLEDTEREIKTALQPFGYYHPQIQSQLTQNPQAFFVHFEIDKGNPTLVGDLSLELTGPAVAHPELQTVFQPFPLETGDIFVHQQYEQGKAEAQNRLHQEGYIEARYSKHQVIVDLSRFQADIDLILESGPQYQFGDFQFQTNDFAPEFLERFVSDKRDTPFKAQSLAQIEGRFLQTGLFKQARLEPSMGESKRVTTQVHLENAAKNRYLLGLGYDTNTRTRLRLGWDRRHLGQWGHHFKSQFKLSEKDTLFDAAYIIPGQKPWSDFVKIAFGYADDEYKDRPSELYTFEISETREIWDIKRTIAIRYLNETFRDSTGVQDRRTFVLPSLRLSKAVLDNPANPQNGYRAEMTVRGGVDALFSDADFAQIHLQYKWLKSWNADQGIAARLELGATFPDDIEKLPLSIRYYAGGIDSLRGFRYRSLPFEVDDEGQIKPVGGAYLALGSLEYLHRLYGPVKGALFVDGGSALRKLSDDWQLGAGFGLRIETPIGPIKIDVAKPLSSAAEVWRLHLSFGPQI